MIPILILMAIPAGDLSGSWDFGPRKEIRLVRVRDQVYNLEILYGKTVFFKGTLSHFEGLQWAQTATLSNGMQANAIWTWNPKEQCFDWAVNGKVNAKLKRK